ncbi:hypothetical protein B0O99DRAFT_662832 [Bisporella sp. PMI_857]|nr:hypothetical protein B0O99DRAFT_662832 [Bisporella sp. PMI_857]
MSDLHLEVNKQYLSFHIPKTASNLILADDIGRLSDYTQYLEFLKIQCQQFSQVFLVLGNHEFYVVLNRTRVAIKACPDIIILGYTLHSRILPEARRIINDRVKDFQRIGNWTRQIRQIRSEKITSGHRIIAASHYPPCVKQSRRPVDLGKPWGSAFGTDILKSDDAVFSNVQAWVFGHTHSCSDFWKCNVRLVSSQRGYIMRQNSREGFRLVSMNI